MDLPIELFNLYSHHKVFEISFQTCLLISNLPCTKHGFAYYIIFDIIYLSIIDYTLYLSNESYLVHANSFCNIHIICNLILFIEYRKCYTVSLKNSILLLSSGQSHSVDCQYITFEIKKKYHNDKEYYLDNSKEESNHFVHLCINVIVVPPLLIIP